MKMFYTLCPVLVVIKFCFNDINRQNVGSVICKIRNLKKKNTVVKLDRLLAFKPLLKYERRATKMEKRKNETFKICQKKKANKTCVAESLVTVENEPVVENVQ